MFTSEDVRIALEDARRYTREGAYDQALERHVWYHENALRYAPAQFGVRLSFALHSWASLGESFPKALDALKFARDEALAIYRRAPDDGLMYLEVMSIDMVLDDLISAKALFYEGREHGVTDSTIDLLERILEVGDTEWARDVIGDPEARLKRIQVQWESVHATVKPGSVPSLNDVFARQIATLVMAVAKTQSLEDARELQRDGLRIIDSPAIRNALA